MCVCVQGVVACICLVYITTKTAIKMAREEFGGCIISMIHGTLPAFQHSRENVGSGLGTSVLYYHYYDQWCYTYTLVDQVIKNIPCKDQLIKAHFEQQNISILDNVNTVTTPCVCE